MKLGIVLPYSSTDMSLPIDRVLEAERLGFDSVWTSEAYGSDAVTPAAWVLARTTRIKVGTAIMQMPARTPAMTAMTAMTLEALSGGRFILGIGPSGPQVVEGWHGVAYGKPLLRTREYIEIIRKILERNEPLTYAGEHYQIPFTGPGATGLGKPLKSIMHGNPKMKIYTASIAPASIRNSAEVEWAQSFRVKPHDDVFVVDRTAAAPLDPATDGDLSSSVGVDATIPIGVDFPEVSEVPGWKDFAFPELDQRVR